VKGAATVLAFSRPPRPERLMLAAIHAFAEQRVPRLDQALPAQARPGDVVVLCGRGFGEGVLQARFGPLASWALAVTDRMAVAMVPAGARPGWLTVQRQGLRSNGIIYGGPPSDGPTCVVRVDPRDGASGVFRDAPVVVSLSHPVEPGSLTPQTVRVETREGTVPGRLHMSPDGAVVIWVAAGPLRPGVEHRVQAAGLRDWRGLPVEPHQSTFVPCSLAIGDVFG
jgi:hypothetical protein